MKRNMSKAGKRLCSLLVILVMVMVLIPSSLWAEEGEEKESQTSSEIESETETESEISATELQSESTESTESTQSDESQPQGNTGSISGIIWLDENQDGVYDSGEKPVAGYEVSLYLSTNTNDTVASVTTDGSGNYTFTDLAPDDYVVGIPLSQKVGDTEYLVPLIGISGDNKFALDETTYDAYTNTISIAADSEAKDCNAGVRLPVGMQTLSVGIQPESSTTYTPNTTVIGFAGYEWWVIGDSGSGVTSPSANAVTLWSKNLDFGYCRFDSITNNSDYNTSELKTTMNALDTNLFSSGNALESGYVINRASMDLFDATGTNTYGYANVLNQMFWPISYQEWTTIGSATVRSYAGASNGYFLRSPAGSGVYGKAVWIGGTAGTTPYSIYVHLYTYAVRPAFYLNLSSILFTSAASGASTKSTTTGSTLQDVSTTWSGSTSAEPIKLTREDNTNLGILTSTTSGVVGSPGKSASFQYSGAKTGTGKSVSVMICNSAGAILYYGRPVDTSSGNASGTAHFTLPSGLAVGDYTLKIFNEQVNGDNYTDYASTPTSIPLKVREVTVSLTASPTTKVYTTDTNNFVDITAVVGYSSTISTIEDVEWFCVPISDTNDYSSNFDTTYAALTANKGTITASSVAGATTETFNLRVYQNAKYWFKGKVVDGSYTFTTVEAITVDNIYTSTPVYARGEVSGSSPTTYLYNYEVVSSACGIPYDLDSTTTAPKVISSSVSGYYDTVTLDAKSQYSTYWNSTMKSGTGLSLTLTLNSAFLTNAECDSGDYTRYTIVYTRRANWTSITAYFVDESGGTLTSAGGLTSETFMAPLDGSGDVTTFSSSGGSYSPPAVTDYTVIGYYVGSTGTFVSCTNFTTFDPVIPVATSGITDVYIVYRKNTTDLAIDKTVTGSYGDPNQEFAVTITLENGGTPVSGPYNYTSTDSSGATTTTGTVTFNASGQATIELKHGQTITIEGITQGYTYTVEETDTAVASGIYSVTYSSTTGTATSSEVTGTLGSASADASIINDRSSVVVSGLSGAGFRIAAVSFLVVLAVAVTTLWCYRRRKKCQ